MASAPLISSVHRKVAVKRIRLFFQISLSIMASISARRLAKELHEIKSEGCPVGGCFRLTSPEPAVVSIIHIFSAII